MAADAGIDDCDPDARAVEGARAAGGRDRGTKTGRRDALRDQIAIHVDAEHTRVSGERVEIHVVNVDHVRIE